MELSDLELLRLYIDDLPEEATGDVFLGDEVLTRLIDESVDLFGAAAKAWKIKAARVSEWYNVSADGTELSRNQAFRHAIDMARTYANESAGEIVSVRMDTGFIADPDEAEMA